jgi:hypothetical protein
MSARRTERKASPFLELALDHVASFIVNANHGIVNGRKICVADCIAAELNLQFVTTVWGLSYETLLQLNQILRSSTIYA